MQYKDDTPHLRSPARVSEDTFNRGYRFCYNGTSKFGLETDTKQIPEDRGYMQSMMIVPANVFDF